MTIFQGETTMSTTIENFEEPPKKRRGRPPGRPPKLTPELEEQILEHRRKGGKYVNAPDEVKTISTKTIERLFTRHGLSRGAYFRGVPETTIRRKNLDNPMHNAMVAVLNEMRDRGGLEPQFIAQLLGVDKRTITKMLDGTYEFTLSQVYRCATRFEGSVPKFLQRVFGYEG